MHNRQLGAFGEGLAEKYLKKNRYKILKKNFYIKGGEIDIIAQKDEYLVFVEVKTRCNIKFGNPAEAVTFHKKHRIIKAAKVFLQKYGNAYARFDVIEIYLTLKGGEYAAERVSHIKNAFTE